jgi:hypothetical protein
MMSVLERAKTVGALDRAATAIGISILKLVVCILLRVLDQVQGCVALDGNPEPDL